MKRTLSGLLAALLLTAPLVHAQRLNSGEKKTLELTPGVVLVLVTFSVTATLDFGSAPTKKEFSYTEFGSGFVYRPDGYIVTNGHVVQHANQKDSQAQDSLNTLIVNEVLRPLASKLFPAVEQQLKRSLTESEQRELLGRIHITHTTPDLKVYLANRRGYQAEITAYSGPIGEGKDVAILKIDATNLPTVKLGNSDNVHIQEPITVIGYPGVASPIDLNALSNESLFIPTVTNGHISAVKSDYKGTPVIQSDAAITHGNSGGPAFNESGEVIGISTFASAKEVAGFNFFVPINTALEFVHQAGTNPESGLFNQLWAQALDTYDAGKCQTARDKFSDVLRIMPGEPDAQRLAANAQACAANESPMAKMMESTGPAVYGVVGAVILIGLLFLVFKKKPAPAIAVSAGVPPMIQVTPPPPGIAAPPPGMSMPGLPPGAERSFGSVQVTAGSLTGRRFPITKQGLLVGRDASKCQVVLTDDTVSKEHAWIVPLDTGVVVIDRGSANGTFVNSTESPRVSKVGLQNGDRVYIGKQGAAVLTYYSS